jgi:5-formyltetrahydrofolate cyclo-ligase
MTDPANSSRKTSLRQQLRRQREAMPAMAQAQASTAICDSILTLGEFKQSDCLAIYLAMPGEVDLGALLEQACLLGKLCCAPVITGKGSMEFRRYHPGDQLQLNSYGINEPLATSEPVAPAQLDLLLVPMVGFDRRGGRLGNGGGYYDRYLAATGSATRLGVAFSCQEVEDLPVDPWDQALDGIITEQETLRLLRAGAERS